MSGPLTLRIRTSLDAIPPAHGTAMAWLERRHVPPAAGVLASLAIDELVTNCIKYAYDDDAEHVVELEMDISEGQLVLRFTDDGRAFNPLDVPAPNLSLPLVQRPVGGLGVFLLRTVADRIAYERRDGRNCLTLAKSLAEVRDEPPSAPPN